MISNVTFVAFRRQRRPGAAHRRRSARSATTDTSCFASGPTLSHASLAISAARFFVIAPIHSLPHLFRTPLAEIDEMPGRAADRLLHTGDPVLPVGMGRVDVEAHAGLRRYRIAGALQQSGGKLGHALDAPAAAVDGLLDRARGPGLPAGAMAVDLEGGGLLGGAEGLLPGP